MANEVATSVNIGAELLASLGISMDDRVTRIVIVADANDVVKVYLTRCIGLDAAQRLCHTVSKCKLISVEDARG